MAGRRDPDSRRVSPRMRVDPEFADIVDDLKKRLGVKNGTDITRLIADEINGKKRKGKQFKIF